MKRYAITLIVILTMSSLRSHAAIEGDVDLVVKQTSLWRMDGPTTQEKCQDTRIATVTKMTSWEEWSRDSQGTLLEWVGQRCRWDRTAYKRRSWTTQVKDSDHDDMEGEEEGYIANAKGADIWTVSGIRWYTWQVSIHSYRVLSGRL
jgi:hypothetical protein